MAQNVQEQLQELLAKYNLKDIYAADEKGNTVAFYAFKDSKFDVVNYLVELDEIAKKEDKHKQSIAFLNDEKIEEYKSIFTHKNNKGLTPIDYALTTAWGYPKSQVIENIINHNQYLPVYNALVSNMFFGEKFESQDAVERLIRLNAESLDYVIRRTEINNFLEKIKDHSLIVNLLNAGVSPLSVIISDLDLYKSSDVSKDAYNIIMEMMHNNEGLNNWWLYGCSARFNPLLVAIKKGNKQIVEDIIALDKKGFLIKYNEFFDWNQDDTIPYHLNVLAYTFINSNDPGVIKTILENTDSQKLMAEVCKSDGLRKPGKTTFEFLMDRCINERNPQIREYLFNIAVRFASKNMGLIQDANLESVENQEFTSEVIGRIIEENDAFVNDLPKLYKQVKLLKKEYGKMAANGALPSIESLGENNTEVDKNTIKQIQLDWEKEKKEYKNIVNSFKNMRSF